MWRCLRFIDNFKGKRPVGINDTYRLVEKIKYNSVANIGSDIIEDIFIPAVEFSQNSEANKYLVGMIFIKYDREYDDKMTSIFRSLQIHLYSVVKESDVLAMKENSSNYQQVTKARFTVGDSIQIINGDYKDMIGTIEFIRNENTVDVNVQVFGRDHIITLNTTMISKLKY